MSDSPEPGERSRVGRSIRGLLGSPAGLGPSLRIPNALPLAVATLLLCLAGLGLAGLASLHFDRRVGDFTRDSAVVFELRGCSGVECGLVGLTSNLGVVAWTASVGVCLFVALVLRLATHHPARHRPYLYFGGLTAVLVLDDLFLFHEARYGVAAWIGERDVVAAYAVSALAIVVSFRAFLTRTSAWILGFAVSFLGASIAIDVLTGGADVLGIDHYLAEDGAKLIGIGLWALFFVGTAAVELGHAISAPGAEPEDA